MRALTAEFLGTAFLLVIVVGSGIMGERLSAGNDAIALLANALATGAGLYVLIVVLGPLSGAHFNPAVSLVLGLRGDLALPSLPAYVLTQLCGALLGVIVVHAMFDLPLLQFSTKLRTGSSLMFSEFVATTGLLGTILLVSRQQPAAIAAAVSGYIAAAYWFTASTSFANPAATIARAMTDTFAGIAPVGVPGFIAGQMLAMLLCALLAWHQRPAGITSPRSSVPL